MVRPLKSDDLSTARSLLPPVQKLRQQRALSIDEEQSLITGGAWTWFYGAGLALSSSSDNFAVGVSLSLSGAALSRRLNGIVALCNAGGAMLAALGGVWLGAAAPTAAPLFAAAVFGYLGWQELASWRAGESASPLAQLAADGLALRLALPMTLNNLAGGVAGGVVGVGPVLAGLLALLASWLAMQTGFALGQRVGPALEKVLEPRLMAALLFVALGAAQLAELASPSHETV